MKKSIVYGTLFAMMATFALEGIAFAKRGGRGPLRDTNGDGVVTLQEAQTNVEERFDRKDTNGDGVITKEEVLAKVQTKFTEIDADGDGQVTQEEKRAHRAQRRAQ